MVQKTLGDAKVWWRENIPHKNFKLTEDAEVKVQSTKGQGAFELVFAISLDDGTETEIWLEISRTDFTQMFEAMVRAGG